MKKLLAFILAWALAATPAFALYGGTVNQGGAATSGPWLFTPWLAGGVISATNGLYVNLLQGNTANASGNPIFAQITAGAVVIGKVDLLGNAGAIMDAAGQNAASPANSLLTGCQFNTTPTTLTNGNMSPCQLDNAGNALVNVKTSTLPTGASTAANQSLNFQTAPVTPTIQNAAYAASNAIGALQTVSIFNTNGGTALLDQFSLTWAGTETVAVTVYLFARNPAASTCTDKAAFSLSTTDAKYLIVPPFVLVAAAPQGTTQTFANYLFAASTQNLDGTPGTNVYVCFVSGGAFTPAVGDLSFTIGGIKP